MRQISYALFQTLLGVLIAAFGFAIAISLGYLAKLYANGFMLGWTILDWWF